ncbi:micronuclear linker histone polyprotein-like [Palaemon carinicauda]|uniref:micronuclear linker histone polyprotein-like n=1 Tax=Palaemon carinicauda TaxID=392227 RepID=UPI0035B66A55
MQQNQVYVIQVNTKTKGGPLALPAPGDALLPSEVKYSASLVRGLGCTHLVLGAVLFLLGVLGSWVEPETCWAGAGIWSGIATIACGICGILAHHLWYKNYAIKAFLVTSVVSVVISTLAIILTIYALVNRYEHYYYLVERAEKYPWFRPYNQNQEQQLTLSVSANQLVGFILEFFLAFWSVKIGWKGVRAEEFSSSRRDAMCDDLQSVVSVPHHNGQQIPLAALYQLLQAHPELLGSKNINGSLGHPWINGLDDRPSHRSMDYQERVSRFLSHAIEDHNASFSRSPSVFQGEVRENSPTTRPSSIAGDCEDRVSPSAGSADTIVMCSDPGNEVSQSAAPSKDLNQKMAPEGGVGQTDTLKSITQIQATRQRPDGQPKGKAPIPKDTKQSINKEKAEGQKQESIEIQRAEHQIGSSRQINAESNENAVCEKLTKENKKNIEQNSRDEKKEEALPQPEEQEVTAEFNHQGGDNVLAEKNAEGETSNAVKSSKDAKKKKSKEKRSSSKKTKEEDPPPPNIEEEERRNPLESRAPPKIEEEERNHLETGDTSEDERKDSSEALTSNKKSKESKKKSKEKRKKPKERIEGEPSQGQEEQDKTETKKSKDHKSHKEEKRKSSKKEVNTVNDEENANETNEHKQNKNRLNETDTKIENTEITPVEIIENGTHSKVNSDTTSEQPNVDQSEKIKKSKKSKRDKNSTEKSKKHKEETKSNSVSDDTHKDKSVQGQLIDIKPPSEFQDG